MFAFGAVVYKLQTRKSYIESLPLVLQVKEAGSLKVKVPLYSCLLIACLPSGSRTLLKLTFGNHEMYLISI